MSEEKNGKNVWITTHGEQWAVKVEGAERARKVFDCKEDALAFGKQLAQKNKGELISQKKNGQINLKNSYGNDSPKDKG